MVLEYEYVCSFLPIEYNHQAIILIEDDYTQDQTMQCGWQNTARAGIVFLN